MNKVLFAALIFFAFKFAQAVIIALGVSQDIVH